MDSTYRQKCFSNRSGELGIVNLMSMGAPYLFLLRVGIQSYSLKTVLYAVITPQCGNHYVIVSFLVIWTAYRLSSLTTHALIRERERSCQNFEKDTNCFSGCPKIAVN
jgi:hypothetical protein